MKDVDAKLAVQALKLIREILSELPPDERAAVARELEPVVVELRQQPDVAHKLPGKDTGDETLTDLDE